MILLYCTLFCSSHGRRNGIVPMPRISCMVWFTVSFEVMRRWERCWLITACVAWQGNTRVSPQGTCSHFHLPKLEIKGFTGVLFVFQLWSAWWGVSVVGVDVPDEAKDSKDELWDILPFPGKSEIHSWELWFAIYCYLFILGWFIMWV